MRELSTKTIITITIVLVATVMTSAFYFDGRFDIKNQEMNKDYDCGKEFDKFANTILNKQYWRGEIIQATGSVPANFLSAAMIKNESVYDFYDNRCYTTYKSWMKDSEFEYFIEKNEYYFDLHSFQEQMINQEIPCELDEYTCDAKIDAKFWKESLEKYCSDLPDNPTEEEGFECMKIISENELDFSKIINKKSN